MDETPTWAHVRTSVQRAQEALIDACEAVRALNRSDHAGGDAPFPLVVRIENLIREMGELDDDVVRAAGERHA
jgi:hypothetical protein